MDISVTTRPNSFVGLLGVDQSVLLLKKGNDIEASTVFQELEKYGNVEKHKYYSSKKWYNDFHDSNAVIITNAKKPYGKFFYKNKLKTFLIKLIFSEKKVQRRGYSHRYGNGVYALSSRSKRFDDSEMCLRNVSRKPNIQEIKPQEIDNMDLDDELEEEEEQVIPKRDIEIRKEFPETWLFENLEFTE